MSTINDHPDMVAAVLFAHNKLEKKYGPSTKSAPWPPLEIIELIEEGLRAGSPHARDLKP
jgi:hypothetical protein